MDPAVAEEVIQSLQNSIKSNSRQRLDRFIHVFNSREVGGQFNHVVFGQRGAGKSTLLRHFQAREIDENRVSTWIDCEKLKLLTEADAISSAISLVAQDLKSLVATKAIEMRNRQAW